MLKAVSPGGVGTVTSVSGTTNRITVATGTSTPVIDISASYVGQASITTVGTLTALSVSGLSTLSSGQIVKTRVVTAAGAVTVTATDYIVIVNKASGASTVVNLPAAGSATGQVYIIKDGKGDAASNNITLTPASGNIDGAATYVISTNYNSTTIVDNGTQYNVI